MRKNKLQHTIINILHVEQHGTEQFSLGLSVSKIEDGGLFEPPCFQKLVALKRIIKLCLFFLTFPQIYSSIFAKTSVALPFNNFLHQIKILIKTCF